MGIAAAQTPEAPAAESAAHAAGSSHLRGGWYPWDPYQYREYRHGVSILTGFDVEIERALARIMRVEISLPPITWEEHLAALADGRADIASGATASEERSAFAYVSKPYRTETDVLILPKGAGRRYPFRTVEQMLEAFAKQRFRLGVIAGYAYADARVNAFIAEPANRDQIVTVASDADNLQNLLDGVIDGFLADRVAANTTAWRNKQAGRIEEHPLRFSTDIHFLLSRATQTPQMLARLDAAIDELKASGEFRRIADALRAAGLDQSDPRQRLVSCSRLRRHRGFCALGRGACLCRPIHIVRRADTRRPSGRRRRRRPRRAVAA